MIIFLVISALLLGFEYRVHIFARNGILILLLLSCAVVYLFMHRGHISRLSTRGSKFEAGRQET